jgi:glycopeptide antibiotics resistance protein
MAGHPRDVEPAPRWLRLTSVVLLVAFCALIAIITFWPGPPDPDGQQSLKLFLQTAYRHGLPTWVTYGKIEFGANILMFVPVGLFGALSLTRAHWLIVPAALAASTVIELVQGGIPERVGSLRDVVGNTMGALIGYVLACLVLRVVRSRAGRRAAHSDVRTAGSPTAPSRISKET